MPLRAARAASLRARMEGARRCSRPRPMAMPVHRSAADAPPSPWTTLRRLRRASSAPAQILDAAAARLLDEAAGEDAKYVKPACVPNHDFCRAKPLEAAAAFVTVKATAGAARATGRGGSGPDAASGAPGMFAGAGMGVATGAMLGTAAAMGGR